jgi:hypothetical protein
LVADELRRIEAEAPVDRGSEISARHRVFRRVRAKGVARAVNCASLHAAAGEEHGVAIGPVVAAGVAVDHRRAAEFPRRDDQCRLEQAAFFQVADQRRESFFREESADKLASSAESDLFEMSATDSTSIVEEPIVIIPPEVLEEVAAEFPPADAAEVVAEQRTAAGPVPIAFIAEPLPPVDFDLALAQPLKLFRQERAVSRQELLELVSEMLGAPIRYDLEALGSAARPLEQKILFELQDATVGDVLAKVLEKTDLDYDRERDGLRLRVK